jgi:transposase
MSYLGLMPSEHSSGKKRTQGGITKTGNGHLRKLVTESSWHYARPNKVSKRLEERRAGADEQIKPVSATTAPFCRQDAPFCWPNAPFC